MRRQRRRVKAADAADSRGERSATRDDRGVARVNSKRSLCIECARAGGPPREPERREFTRDRRPDGRAVQQRRDEARRQRRARRSPSGTRTLPSGRKRLAAVGLAAAITTPCVRSITVVRLVESQNGNSLTALQPRRNHVQKRVSVVMGSVRSLSVLVKPPT